MSGRQGNARAALSERGDDLYETPPDCTRALIASGAIERVMGRPADEIMVWEPCAGRGAIVEPLRAAGFEVCAQDLRAYPGAPPYIATPIDFLMERRALGDIIVTNPPYKLADAFLRHGLHLGRPVIALLRLAALEGASRSDLIDGHLREVLLGIERPPMMHRHGWQGDKIATSGVPFAWFVFAPAPRPPGEVIALRRISWRGA